MRWQNRRRSNNVEDRRGQGSSYRSAGVAPVVLRLLPALIRTKIGRVILFSGIALVVGSRMLGIDMLSVLSGGGSSPSYESSMPVDGAEQQLAEFVSVVLADTEETWHAIFNELGRTYREPTLVLFTASVNSACGYASAATGPFYCPGDQKLYIDLSFFHDLGVSLGAPGDFAQAYVIAHEVGHHVQTLLGISEQVVTARRRASQVEGNALSVKQELQADCFAGLWGNTANIDRQLLELGDLEEALQAATAIGDDRLQRTAGRAVVPDSFTHGTSAQRVRWFRVGFESGDMGACDTF